MKKGVLLIFSLLHLSLFPQKFDFKFWEDSLVRLRNEVMACPDETRRFSLNEDFMNLLENVILEPKSFEYAWPNATNFSVLEVPDKLFKLFTWHVEKENRSVENFGFLHVYNEQRKKFVLFPLYDKRNALDYPEMAVGDHNRWYGAVYYAVIPLETKGKTYYTLLGWNGNNLFSHQKIIEVLSFKKERTPVFGAKVFKNFPKGKVARVVFEYNKNAVLTLRYEPQSYYVNTGKRDPKTKRVIYNPVTGNMIVFNELLQMVDGMPEIPAYLVPESSLNQGFVAQDGVWVFLSSVTARNPDKPLPTYHHKNRSFYLPPQ